MLISGLLPVYAKNFKDGARKQMYGIIKPHWLSEEFKLAQTDNYNNMYLNTI